MDNYLFTSESVTEGHPDKICDQISDAVLDEILRNDPKGRVACETACTTGMVLIMGEITTNSSIDYPGIARKVIRDIGYNNAEFGFDSNTCSIMTSIDKQSPDIALGVNQGYENKTTEKKEEGNEVGAGDQGMMFGYACNETSEYMPMPISLSHKLALKLTQVRKENILPYLRPDGKTQVTVEYRDGKPYRVDTIVISSQHAKEVSLEQIKADIIREVIRTTVDTALMDGRTKVYVNPTGRFIIGGPQGDSGLTGRKIIVDTYGGYARHGGGAFSGKDPTKVDRSAAYAARWVAKNIVAAGLASKCEVQLSYAIGIAHPISIMIDTFGTGTFENETIADAVNDVFDLRPNYIIQDLELQRPIYQQIAAYGHFGRDDLDLPWERIDRAEQLKNRILYSA